MQRVHSLGVADRIVVATDSEEIRDAVVEARRRVRAHVARASVRAPIASPRLRGSRPTAGFDAILNVQGDEPFVSASAVRGALDAGRRRLSARHGRRARQR